MSRLAPVAGAVEFVALDRPFSNFTFLEARYRGYSSPIHRLFSQARARSCLTLIIEVVEPAIAVLDEVKELTAIAGDYTLGALHRLSFWRVAIASDAELNAADAKECIGYALLKHDICPSLSADRWHVFESVIRKHDHKHNYTPCDKSVTFRVLGRELSVSGVLYGQQNGLNKACAQVGLRSLCANYLGNFDLTYSLINKLAFGDKPVTDPSKGLTTLQTANVLNGLGVNFTSLSYGKHEDLRKVLPYQRAVYSGIESATGSLLIFSLPDEETDVEKNRMHMIACFGHTFNEDTWAPTAEVAYFGADSIRYTPSDAWMSSFLVHDDNVGSNLCIPKGYLKPEVVRHAIVLLPTGFCFNGFIAEMIAANFFYSVVDHLAGSQNAWYKRLVDATRVRKLILRVVPVTKASYIAHLRAMDDWEFRLEKVGALAELDRVICTNAMWMIEVSIPDLFPTNKRKVGEVLLDASKPLVRELNFALFVLARLPGSYVFLDRIDPSTGAPQFLSAPSSIESHSEVLMR